MSEMTIRLETDSATGKKNIIVSVRSDDELLPMEHEQQHRQLVERLIGLGLVEAAELGTVVIEREEPVAQGAEVPSGAEPQKVRESVGQGE